MRSLYDDVYGLTFQSALEQIEILRHSIQEQLGVGFGSEADAAKWAHEHLLDKIVYSSMNHTFYNVSHKGEIINASTFKDYYQEILFIGGGKRGKPSVWIPTGFEYYDKAYIATETSDGRHKPLYKRDYFVPTGFYDAATDTFNVAKSFEVPAKETGADTSHIYKYIEHVGAECAPWLLAWLRAKLLYPTVKTQVVPIIVSRAQGSGKSTFGEVICKGLFGKDNVLVTDQYDSMARFNSDYADALIVCQEEKEETDRRNPAASIKSRATATMIRKELKGVDPIYQESYTDFIMTTNKDVPIKFDGREDQRRFMIMNADEHFTRKESELADEVFTKLYGYDANYNKTGTPFTEDKDLIAQFKHELFSRADIAAIKLREFPHTAAYKRCFTLPRTSEATDIESILRSLAPFLKESLDKGKIVEQLDDGRKLTEVAQMVGALQFMPAYMQHSKYVAVCRPLVFFDIDSNRPYQHSVVERGIYDCGPWLLADYGLAIIPDMDPVPGGFTKVSGRYRTAPAAKFCLASDVHSNPASQFSIASIQPMPKQAVFRNGKRFRVNKNFVPDENGCFETVNELPADTTSLKDKTQRCLYLDTFLFEADEPTVIQWQQEKKRADEWYKNHSDDLPIQTDILYKERLHTQLTEAKRLFDSGIACRVVYSGAKSYHMLVRVYDSPKTLEEYKWLHAYLCTTLSDVLVFDEATSDPARLTRSPVTLTRITTNYNILVEGEQKLVYENWDHVYGLKWRELMAQWNSRPLSKYEQEKGRRLVPTKEEYRKAMEALVEGTFWTSRIWDGKRQLCFFPAYRLLRLLGYSHIDIWNKIVPNGLDNYYKSNEIGYWKSRANSKIIEKIDADIDEYERIMGGK